MSKERFAIAVAKAIASGLSAYKSYTDGDTSGAGVGAAAAVQPLLQEALKEFAGESFFSAEVLEQRPTETLELAIAILSILEWINGFGVPEKGKVLTDTAKPNFDSAFANLQLAIPDGRWTGDAADAYTAIVAAVQTCVLAVQSVDKDLQGFVQSQAGMVSDVRSQFSYTKAGLLGCIPVAWAIYVTALFTNICVHLMPYPAAQQAALKTTTLFQRGVSLAALGAIITETAIHIANVEIRADSVRTLADRYQEAMDDLPELSPTVSAVTPPPSKPASPSRKLVGAGGDIPVTPPRPYPVAAGGGDNAAGNGDNEAPGQPEAPATPATPITPAAASTPPSTPPTGPHPTRPTRPVTAQPDRAAAKEPAPGADVEHSGAAAGAEGADRAPIELVAEGLERVREPSPASRSTP